MSTDAITAIASRSAPGKPPREQFVSDDTPRELVGATVERVAADLLGSHVERGSQLDALDRERRKRGRLGFAVGVDAAALAAGDAEVEHLHHPVLANHHVLRLDVAVNEPAFVRHSQRPGDVGKLRDARRCGDGSISDRAAQRPTRDELHDDERRPLVLANVEDGDGVGVVERRRSAGLAEEASVGIGVGAPVALAVGDDLESHAPPQPGVMGAVDAAHPSLPEWRLDRVAVERVARLQHRAGG